MAGKKEKRKGVKYGVRKRQEGEEVSQPNQWQGTPQQEKWLFLYLDPKSPTFANPYASALEAGYSEYYARVIAAPSVNRLWIKEARNMMSMMPEHIIQGIQKEAREASQPKDRLKAYELLAKFQGMMVDRQVVAHVNIEEALRDLK